MRELLKRIWKKEEGFSLIELIIVIAILAIIAAIAVPNLLGNINKANVATDESNAKLIADAVATYIANTPALEGEVVASARFFTDAGADANDDQIINGAIGYLNGGIPTIKSNTNGTVGAEFGIAMDGNGVITVYGNTGAVGAYTQGVVIFP